MFNSVPPTNLNNLGYWEQLNMMSAVHLIMTFTGLQIIYSVECKFMSLSITLVDIYTSKINGPPLSLTHNPLSGQYGLSPAVLGIIHVHLSPDVTSWREKE